MKWCRDCKYWVPKGHWQGNCRLYPWHKDKYSQDADAGRCPEYTDKCEVQNGDNKPIVGTVNA